MVDRPLATANLGAVCANAREWPSVESRMASLLHFCQPACRPARGLSWLRAESTQLRLAQLKRGPWFHFEDRRCLAKLAFDNDRELLAHVDFRFNAAKLRVNELREFLPGAKAQRQLWSERPPAGFGRDQLVI